MMDATPEKPGTSGASLTLTPQTVDRLPKKPGVYQFRDASGALIYVGKAKSLRDRVKSYFARASQHDAKTLTLVSHVATIDFIVTRSEKEALILEDALIKRHRPRYNVDLKDDKRYLCIRIDTRHPFPAIQFVRRFKPDGAFYAGPFTSAESVRRTIRLLRRYFPLRSCTDRKFAQRTRPCLNYEIHRCLAPCVGYVSQNDYAKLVRETQLFLTGNREGLVRNLREQMAMAAESLDFERAAVLRDELAAISKTLERQMISSPNREDMDVFGAVRREGWWGVFVAFFRQGTLMGSHYAEVEDAGFSEEAFLSDFLIQFYGRNSFIPPWILVPYDLPDAAVLREWLKDKRGGKVTIHAPRRGEKRRLVDLATENARVKFDTLKRSRKDPVAELQAALEFPALPRRIACYDISTLQGHQTVGVRVSFLNGVPEKALYRRFRVREAAPNDDVGSMIEVLMRSLRRDQEEGHLPDMILLDGGKGQLSAGEEVLKELNLTDISLVAIAKGRSMKQRFSDYFYILGRQDPVRLEPRHPAFRLLSRIRDEAHRFAITYHRKRRGKTALASRLLDVPGIGEKRLKILYRAYPSLEAILKAPTRDLANLPTFNQKLAERIKKELGSPQGVQLGRRPPACACPHADRQRKT